MSEAEPPSPQTRGSYAMLPSRSAAAAALLSWMYAGECVCGSRAKEAICEADCVADFEGRIDGGAVFNS